MHLPVQHLINSCFFCNTRQGADSSKKKVTKIRLRKRSSATERPSSVMSIPDTYQQAITEDVLHETILQPIRVSLQPQSLKNASSNELPLSVDVTSCNDKVSSQEDGGTSTRADMNCPGIVQSPGGSVHRTTVTERPSLVQRGFVRQRSDLNHNVISKVDEGANGLLNNGALRTSSREEESLQATASREALNHATSLEALPFCSRSKEDLSKASSATGQQWILDRQQSKEVLFSQSKASLRSSKSSIFKQLEEYTGAAEEMMIRAIEELRDTNNSSKTNVTATVAMLEIPNEEQNQQPRTSRASGSTADDDRADDLWELYVTTPAEKPNVCSFGHASCLLVC